MKCPHCGDQHPDQASFCPKTGKTLKQPDVCANCGANLPSDVSFCPVCGTAVNSTQSSIIQLKISQVLKQPRVRLALIICFIFAFGMCAMVLSNIKPITPAQQIPTKNTTISTPTLRKFSTATTRPTSLPTTKPISTQINLQPIPADYKCPDRNRINLQVGAFAEIVKLDVNLREQPIVPQVSDANVILVLRKGDKVQVIDGPTCSHDGTWWKVKTESGRVGWAREISKGNVLLTRTDE
ncbi:MAG: zinc-ribbon domain-containing protein [Anaerolineales bacterium]|nr:zinc-ribbon domain-containing protein [Anaerolineales bacterium]